MTHDQSPNNKKPNPSTLCVWSGETEHALYEGATQQPVVHSVSFGYDDIDTWHAVALEKAQGHIYSRNTNPTVRAFEEKVRDLEGAAAATSFSSGMAAISNTLNTFLHSGNRVVSIKDSYGGTNKLFTEFLPPMGIAVALCETTDYAAIEDEVGLGCKLLYLESPTNPTVKIIDIERLAKAAKKVGAVVVVDNTFATPINQNPLQLGADIVIHSATKYLGGHADALGGVACGSHELIKKIYHYREINGAALSPMDAYSLLRGMKTLGLRIDRQNRSALIIARWLQQQPMVEQVNYPGLPSHPNHDIAAKQMRGFGGMLSFSVVGGLDAIKTFLPRLRYPHMAATLGCVETVVVPPLVTRNDECPADERAAPNIPHSMSRNNTRNKDVDDHKSPPPRHH